MKQRVNPGDIAVEKLNETNIHHTIGFSSKVCMELDAFLKENAWNEQAKDFSKTYLFFHKGILAGYITLLADKQSIKINDPSRRLSKFGIKTDNHYSSIPALKIGRMCVADNFNGQLESAEYYGLGKIMFASIIDYANEIKDKIGCRVITTHAKKSTGAYKWYLKLGFVFSHGEEKTKDLLAREDVEAIPMFFDINRIIK